MPSKSRISRSLFHSAATVRLLLAAIAWTATCGAASADGGDVAAATVEMHLSSFRFDPSTVHLVHGRRYVFHFVNLAGGGHDFVARRFFAAAGMSQTGRAFVRGGEVELAGRAQASLELVAPSPGQYEFHCSHLMHETFGMKGRLVVE